MGEKLEEKFVSDDGQSTVEDPVTPEGGDASFVVDGSDIQKGVAPGANIKESISSLFEGEELSESFKDKASLVFEAAINEQVKIKLDEAKAQFDSALEEATSSLEEQMQSDLSEAIDSIIEQLDSYLDYVVNEWADENRLAIESGVKVEMAESLMDGLRGLFESHNIDVSEEKLDLIEALQEEADAAKAEANRAIAASIKLNEEISELKAMKVFTEVAEGLTASQADRLTTLAENLDYSDLDKFKADLSTLKETFFKAEERVITEQVAEETFVEEKTETKKMINEDHEVAAIANALKFVKK